MRAQTKKQTRDPASAIAGLNEERPSLSSIQKQNCNPAPAIAILRGGATEQVRDDFLMRRTKKSSRTSTVRDDVAERVGFEPTVPLPVHLISSQSRYPDFEGKRWKLTDNARVCKPLKNQHFSALEGRKSRKPRQSKEFERNPVLGRKKLVGEKMGRTRGEITVQCR